MTTKEAKNKIAILTQRLIDENIIDLCEEDFFTEVFEVMMFALKNMLPDNECDNNRNKCKYDCPFIKSDFKDLCYQINPEQNCYQCLVKNYEMCKLNLKLRESEIDKLKSQIALIDRKEVCCDANITKEI